MKKITLLSILCMFLTIPIVVGQSSFSTSGRSGIAKQNPPAGTASKNHQNFGPFNNLAPVVITHSLSQTLSQEGAACGDVGIPAENNFYRDFNLADDFQITNDFVVSHVEFGGDMVSGPIPVTLKIFSTTSTFPTGYPGSLTLRGTSNYTITAADSGQVVSVPLTATIPAGEIMVFEYNVNPGAVNVFYPGANNLGETGTSWIQADDCGISNPISSAGIGFPDMHLVMNVVGEEDSGGGPLTYCTASGNNSTWEHITNVTYAGINNTTSAPHPGYNDFTAQVANVHLGETDQISVTVLADGSDYLHVFIDWNQNGILDDSGEVYTLATSTSSNGPHTMNITVPAGAELGDTRMRVKMGWLETTPNPCGTFSYGEVEDYTVNVQPAPVGNPPVIVCPADITANNDAGLCTAVVNFSDAVAIDLEDGAIPTTQTAGLPSGSAFPVGTSTIEFSATDSDGNTVTCEFEVTVIDNEDPLAVCKDITVDLDALGAYTLTAAEINNGSSDNCGIATYELATTGAASGSLTTTFAGGNALAGSMFDLEAINNLTIDSFDVNMPTGETGNIEVYFKTGTWVGSESNPAAWTLVGTPMNITSAGVGLPTPLNLNLGINVAAGARVAFYITRTTGSLTYTNGTTVGALFASDANLQMFEGAGKGYPFGSTFQPRNFNGNIVYSTDGVMTPFSGALDCSHIGTNDIYLLVTDNSGNVSSCLATVTVRDVTAPEVFCVGGFATFTEYEDFEGASIPTGWTTVIESGAHDWTFGSGVMPGGSDFPTKAAIFDDDAAGSGSGANKARLVSPSYDLAGATNVELSFDYSIQDYAGSGTFEAEVWNGTAWQRILFVDDIDQDPINSGIIDVSAHLNAAFQVRFTYDDENDWAWGAGVDNFLLEYEKGGGGGLDVYLDADGLATIDASDLVLGVTEACGYTITIGGGTGGGGTQGTISTDFDSNNGGSPGWIQFFDITVGPNDINITDLDVNTSATTAVNMELYTLVGTYVGNELDAAAWGAPVTTGTGTGAGTDLPSNITLIDPVVLSANTTYGIGIQMDVSARYTNGTGCPGNECYSNADLSLTLGAVVSGQFTGSLFKPRVFNGTINYTSGSSSTLELTCANLGENLIEITVTDDSGNESTCMAVVNVIDNTPPVLVCLDATIELGADGTTVIDPYDLLDSFFDACGISSIAVDLPVVTCADIGAPITVTVFASDASGNIASCTAIITVVDNLAPVLTCPANQTQDPGVGNLYYIVPDYFATGEATAIDNCTSPVITSQSPAAGTALSDGTYTVTLTAEDEYGNVSTCDFELTIESILGIADNLEKGVSLYPNPTTSIVNLVNKTNLSLDKMVIFDINGKMISQIDLRSMQSEKSVDVSSFASGVYMVQIIGDNASTVKRLIIE